MQQGRGDKPRDGISNATKGWDLRMEVYLKSMIGIAIFFLVNRCFDDDSNLTNNKNYINYKKFSDRMRECIDL